MQAVISTFPCLNPTFCVCQQICDSFLANIACMEAISYWCYCPANTNYIINRVLLSNHHPLCNLWPFVSVKLSNYGTLFQAKLYALKCTIVNLGIPDVHSFLCRLLEYVSCIVCCICEPHNIHWNCMRHQSFSIKQNCTLSSFE